MPEHTCHFYPAGRAIDMVYLARQSLGDRALETELLTLFERQAGQILLRLSGERYDRDPQASADLAHALKGSALAVGASRVAAAAAAFEAAVLPEIGAQGADRQMQALRVAVEEARNAVAQLLAA